SFIVEPNEKTYDRDYTLMLDEWMSKPEEGESSMEGMDHSNMGSEEDKDKETDSEESSMSGMDHGSMESEDNESMNGMG
ncbi:hypothetical protein OSK38_29770, partial [Escherichia coli]|nr:hypothetical protein [Escherichia coli]